jgi:hypothetical protein
LTSIAIVATRSIFDGHAGSKQTEEELFAYFASKCVSS